MASKLAKFGDARSKLADLGKKKVESMRSVEAEIDEGTLIKEGEILKNSNKQNGKAELRFLKIFDNLTMKYYEDKSLKNLRGTIELKGCNIDKTDVPPMTTKGTKFKRNINTSDTNKFKFGFKMYTPAAQRTWFFYADSETERDAWINAVKKLIGKDAEKNAAATKLENENS